MHVEPSCEVLHGPTNVCDENEDTFSFKFMTDSRPKSDNKDLIENKKEMKWRKIIQIQNFNPSKLNKWNLCLDRFECYRFKLIVLGVNGVCCE